MHQISSTNLSNSNEAVQTKKETFGGTLTHLNKAQPTKTVSPPYFKLTKRIQRLSILYITPPQSFPKVCQIKSTNLPNS